MKTCLNETVFYTILNNKKIIITGEFLWIEDPDTDLVFSRTRIQIRVTQKDRIQIRVTQKDRIQIRVTQKDRI